jgi:hypothetical protein
VSDRRATLSLDGGPRRPSPHASEAVAGPPTLAVGRVVLLGARLRLCVALLGAVPVVAQSGGCMALSPQLPPTDFAALERVEDREDRERLYAENQIYRHNLPQGMRYTKGTSTSANKRSWQSLDVILRSDSNSSAALPIRQQRLARLFTALTIVAGIVTVAGAAASAREGLNLGDLNGTGALLLGGGLGTLGFAITSGIFYGKTRKGYESAVDIYNDSLGMRLGILDGNGKYLPPPGTLLDADGNVVLDPMADDAASPKPEPEPAPEPEVTAPESEPTEPVDDAATEQPPAEETPAKTVEPVTPEPVAPEVVAPKGVIGLRLSPR